MPEPDHMLGVGSGSHGEQTARVLERLEPVLRDERPDLVLVPGRRQLDPGGGAVRGAARDPGRPRRVRACAASTATMPEEINRIVTDHLSELLLPALGRGGGEPRAPRAADDGRIEFVGNTMIDTLVALEARFRERDAARGLGLEPGVVSAGHASPPGAGRRPAARRGDRCAGERRPRACRSSSRSTRAPGRCSSGERDQAGLRLVDPVGYLDFLSLEADAGAVLTDSGGIQEETTFLGVPVLHPARQHRAAR